MPARSRAPHHARSRPSRRTTVAGSSLVLALGSLAFLGADTPQDATAATALTSASGSSVGYHGNNGHHGHYRWHHRKHVRPTPSTPRPVKPTPSPTNPEPTTPEPTPTTATPTPTPTTPSPKPTPTTPEPTPTVTAPSGGYGVPKGTKLTASGNLTVSKQGATVSGLDVAGCITVTASDVTIKNTRVRGTCDLVVDNRGRNLTLDHVEIDGKGSSSTLGLGHDNFTGTGLYIHGVGDGVRANGNVTLQNSWITDLASGGGSHNDGVQVTQGSKIRLVDNVIENRNTQTSAILIGADQGNVSDVLVQGNTLAGGGYTLYGGARPPAGNTIANIVLKNNRFSTKYFSKSGAYGPMTATDDQRISVSGNVWDETGRPAS